MFLKQKFTETEMIAGCVANDRRAQEQLYRQYFQPIWSMCMKYMKSEPDAMDILNDGFLKVFLKIDKYENKGNLEGWIRRVVYNTMVDHIRKNQRYTRFMVFEDYDSPSQDIASSTLFEEDLLKEIDKLPYLSKKVFELHAIQGYNHNEIAQLLEINEGTSRWYLSEARKKLKEKISNNYIGSNTDVR
jgi:RNA polymerase sigma factor (sigma-70 family)